RHGDGAHRVDVLDGIERDAPHHVCRVVAKMTCRIAMGRLMHGDGKQHRNGVDGDGLDDLCEVHGGRRQTAIVPDGTTGSERARFAPRTCLPEPYSPKGPKAPCPSRITSGSPPLPIAVRSITVVGSSAQAPASMTPARSCW